MGPRAPRGYSGVALPVARTVVPEFTDRGAGALKQATTFAKTPMLTARGLQEPVAGPAPFSSPPVPGGERWFIDTAIFSLRNEDGSAMSSANFRTLTVGLNVVSPDALLLVAPSTAVTYAAGGWSLVQTWPQGQPVNPGDVLVARWDLDVARLANGKPASDGPAPAVATVAVQARRQLASDPFDPYAELR